MERRWDKVDGYALAASIAAHVLLFGLIWAGLMRHKATLPQPQPMAVEILAETDLESTSPTPDADAPAAFQAPEDGPIDDAPAAEAVPLPEPTPVPPLPQVKPVPAPPVERTVERVLKKALVRPEPKAVPKPVAKATPTPAKTVTKTLPAKTTPTKATPTKVAPARSAVATPATKTGTGTGKGNAARPSGDLASIVSGIGKTKNNSASTGAPGAKSAAQIKQSITTKIASQAEPYWNRCAVSGIDVDLLRTSVVFHMGKDGTVTQIESVNTTGINDSNRTQVRPHQECAKKALKQVSRFSGLPAENYDYWKRYPFTFRKSSR